MSNRPLQLPTLHILEIKADRLIFAYIENSWIGENFIAYIMPVLGIFLRGRFVHLNPEKMTGQFVFDRSNQEPKVEVGKDYEFLDGYWGQLAEIVFGSFQWKLQEFVVRDAICHSNDGTTNIIPGGWDHEHCLICSEKIGQGGDSKGYVNQNDGWVCLSCYQSFIVPRNLDFINIS